MSVKIEWTTEYSVGVEKFDEHHKKLFAIVDEIRKSIEKEDRLKLAEVAIELYEYTNFHFAAEEVALLSNKYPKAKEHIEEHHNFKVFVTKFCGDLTFYGKDVMLENMDYCLDWLTKHIGKSDKAYAEFFRDQGIEIT